MSVPGTISVGPVMKYPENARPFHDMTRTIQKTFRRETFSHFDDETSENVDEMTIDTLSHFIKHLER